MFQFSIKVQIFAPPQPVSMYALGLQVATDALLFLLVATPQIPSQSLRVVKCIKIEI